jgi:hypothetical protein
LEIKILIIKRNLVKSGSQLDENGVGWNDAEWTVRNRFHLEIMEKPGWIRYQQKRGLLVQNKDGKVYRDAYWKMTQVSFALRGI